MSIRKQFNDKLGIKEKVTDEKIRFVNRVNQKIFHEIDTNSIREFNYKRLIIQICEELGVNFHDLKWREIPPTCTGGPDESIPPELRTLTGNNFKKTLLVLSSIYPYIAYRKDHEDGQNWLSRTIKSIQSKCT